MKIKKILAAVIVVVAAVCVGADTWTDPATGYTWTYTVSGDTVQIRKISPTPTGALTIPTTLGGKNVTCIGDFAFEGCRGLTSVTIPDSVTSIGDSAFGGCSGLTSVTIPDSVTSIGYSAFYGCSGLTSVTIPDSVTSILYQAFYNCSGLTSVTIPDSVTSIGDSAFERCRGLTSVTIPDSVTYIGCQAFYNCSGLTSVTIPDSVTSIGHQAFIGCSDSLFDTTTIPRVKLVDGWAVGYTDSLSGDLVLTGVRGIGSWAFMDCSGLTSVTIPNSVKSIGDYAFRGCSGLTSVTIGNSVKSIGCYAFSGCSGLTSVTIPDRVTSIGGYAFRDCGGLMSIFVGSGNAKYKSVNGLLLSKDGKTIIEGINGDVTIPDSVTSIGSCEFSGRSGLKSVTIPDSVTSIGSSAFSGCSGLEEITLPFVGARRGNTGSADSLFGYIFGTESYAGGIQTRQYYSSARSDPSTYYIPSKLNKVVVTDETVIGYGSFSCCSGLTDVTILDGVTSIQGSAFSYCDRLDSVVIPDSVTSIGSFAFAFCPMFSTVTIGSGVTRIGGGAFTWTAMASVYIADIAKWCAISFGGEGSNPLASGGRLYVNGVLVEGTLKIPDGVTNIGNYAFDSYSELTAVEIPRGVTNIGHSAFNRCDRLTSVTIPEGVTSIGENAFWGCGALASVTIPDSVTSIGGWAFQCCDGLEDVTIGKGLASIEYFGFRDCEKLDAVYISDIAQWCGVSFSWYANPLGYAHKLYLNGSPVEYLVVPDGVSCIGDYVFEGCSTLKCVTIPDSVARIGYHAFCGCGELTTVGMRGDCPSVETAAFSNVNSSCVVYLPRWNSTYVVTDGRWQGMNVEYYDQIFQTITFDANGGGGGKSMTLENGTPLVAPAVTREGYTFAGWSPIVPGTVPFSNVTYTAQWRPNRYAVIFDANGGTGGQTVRLDYGTSVVPPVVSREGYAFVAWSTSISGGTNISESTTVTGDATYYAQWVANKYMVTFDTSGGAGGDMSMMATYDSEMPSIAVPTRSGYVFDGYWSEVNGGGIQYFTASGECAHNWDLSGAATLYAKWKPLYEVSFDKQGGTGGTACILLTFGSVMPSVEVPARSGYAFAGYWSKKDGSGVQYYTDTGKSVRAWDFAGDRTLYAKWLPTSTIYLDQNGGTGGTTSTTAVYGSSMPSIILPKRQGYTFCGYWTDEDAEGDLYYTSSGASFRKWDKTGSVTLYAKWIEGEEFNSDMQYCVILLSPGANASSYPVAYMAAPPMGGFNTDDYKTTKLVLKLIEPGEFKMGGSYDVTLTKPFYCGLFEVTQKQYELVMGSNPSSSTGGMRPVENVTWEMIRGDSSTYNWPNVTGVNPSSFVGRLQARTGLNFDLPTEAQWEYACRAGTTSTYNNGGSSETDLKKLGRYGENTYDGKGGYSNGHTVVGSYEANRWGFYDMHGNVYEWCLDWYGNLAGGVTDPVGPASASKRVERGGGWRSMNISYCSSTYRIGDNPSSAYNDCGFRLVQTGTESYHIVNFNVNGGSMAAANAIRFVAPGAPIGTLPTPKLSGYAFDGWWTEATGGTKITAATTIAGGATYYAHWAKMYTVTFNPSGGSLDSASKTRSVKNGSSVGSLPNPTRTGYAFAGWWTSASGGVQISASTIVTGDLTCYAHWLANKYAVTFDANGGGVNESNRSVTFGSVVGELPTPTRTGYAFKGWWTSATGGTQISASTVVAGDMALYAHWTPIYTVTFDANGGSVDESNRGVESGSAVGTLPTASRTGYSFAGWWTTASGGVQISASTKITEAVTYYAHWSCAVTFNANGGSVNESSRRVVSGSAVGLLPTPARSGYIFDGWFTETSGGARISPSAIISCPVTYYAHWTWTDKPILTIDSTGALTAVDLNGNTDVVIPDGVTRIESFAFKGCYNLTSVTIPDSVMRIGASAFYGCGALEKISLPFVGARRGNTGGDDSFFGYIFGPSPYTGGTSTTQYDGSCSARYYIPSNLRSVAVTDENILGAGVFYGCKGLTSVMIPNSVTSIGVCAFFGCSGLASLTIPNSVISIGKYAFDGCSGFTSVTIPDSVTSIGDSAFGYCSGLTSVTIPDSVTSFGFNVFSGCSGIREVVVPQYLCTNGLRMLFPQYQSITNVFISDSVTSIGEAAFYGYSGLASVTIPSGVTNIGNSAFYSCSGLASVTIPNSVTSIGDRAFGYCSGLTSVTIPDAVTSIGDYAFYDCSGLRSVTIPDSVTSIGSYAFSGCSGLTSVYVAFGYADRVKELMRSSGFDVTKISFIELGAAYIVFNANGGGVAEQSRKVAVDDQVGELPTPTRTGHTFTGWFTAANGGTAVSASTVVTEIVTYYAHWTVNKYTVTFDANGGAGGKTVTQNYGTALAAPTVTRTGYMFAGWSPAAPAKVPAGNATYVAQWTKDKYTVTFNANGGAGGWSRSMDYGAAIAAPTVTRAGYTFAGWSPAVSKTVPIGGACYTAQWTINRHQIRLALNGGEGVGSVTVDYGTRVGDLPVPTRDGYEFLGWFTAPRGGSRIADNAIVTGDMTLYAQWHTVLLELYELIDGAAPAAAASEYNGYLYDEKSGAVKGTIQVKVGKPNAKTGLATIKATVVVGTKKVTLKGVEKGKSVLSSDGPTELALVGGESCEIVLGAEGISGYYGEYVIDGSRNFFTSKDKAEQRAVNDVLAKWLGSFMVIWDGGSLSVSIAAKGKVKVSGTLADGKTKVSASTVLLVGEEWSCVSVTAQKANLTFVLWLSHDGKTIEAEGLGDNVLVGLPGTLANGAAFQIDADEFAAVFGQTMLPYLPDGVPVTQKGTKWTLPKAGKVVYKNGAPDESKLGDNPCGLKLTYKSKDGTFKGSFKVYAEVKGKPKATTVNVTGFMLNGIGYGTATIKKVGSVPILIE